MERVWIDGGDTAQPQGGAGFYRCVLFSKPRSGVWIWQRTGKLSKKTLESESPLPTLGSTVLFLA